MPVTPKTWSLGTRQQKPTVHLRCQVPGCLKPAVAELVMLDTAQMRVCDVHVNVNFAELVNSRKAAVELLP